eukprot:7057423-Pyramimonas_sp.AAC.1
MAATAQSSHSPLPASSAASPQRRLARGIMPCSASVDGEKAILSNPSLAVAAAVPWAVRGRVRR